MNKIDGVIYLEWGDGDAAHYGPEDLYEDNLEELKVAIASGKPYETGWYSCKKEPVTAEITFDGEKVSIDVSLAMDDMFDLVDTAIWESDGKKENDGASVLERIFGADWEGVRERIFESIELSSVDIHHENYEACSRVCANELEQIIFALNEADNEADLLLQRRYNHLVAFVKNHIEWKLENEDE